MNSTANAFRNLYCILDDRKVVAFITAGSVAKALDKYRANGGKVETVEIDQRSFGYPCDICNVYA